MRIARLQLSDETTCFTIAHENGDFSRASGDPFRGLTDTGEIIEGKLLAPIDPADIMCIGLNYKKHAEEAGAEIPRYPVLFFKNTGAVQNPGDPIRLPRKLTSEKVDYEAELAVVIGKTCYNVCRENALEYVLGYSCANDVSARDWQRHAGGGQWCRGKTFATFCPLGPVLVTPDEIVDPNNLGVKSILNGKTMQNWNTNDMIFDVPALIEYLSSSTVLVPGTVILTGTPHGVGFARKPPVWLVDGDEIAIDIEGIGTLKNPVCEEAP